MSGLLSWLRSAVSVKASKSENVSALTPVLNESKQAHNGDDKERNTEMHKDIESVESQLDSLVDLDPTVPELRILGDVETGIDEAIGFNPYDTAAISDKLDVEKD